MPDLVYVLQMIEKIIKAVPYTAAITLAAAVISTVFSILLTVVYVRRLPGFYQLLSVYISFFRSTPSLIHIFIVYYGLPLVLKPFGIVLDASGKTLYAICALSLFYTSYLIEIIRPAYLSIDKGQHEAALSIGLKPLQKEFRIIVPQVVPIILPAMGTAFIELIKDTSVLFVIGLTDIMGKANIIITNDYGVKKLEVYIAVGAIYWVITTIGSFGNQYLEKKCKGMRRGIV